MKFGSLFSGIGGFDLGFERAGLECAWQVEIDKDCQRVLANQFPFVERFEDVTRIGSLSRVDVLCGGFPCQDLSVAGKREGLAGERSGLWFEFLRLIRTNLPRWIVIENVPGLLSSNRGNDFAVILRGLAQCGYSVAWRVLDAQFYGVAQRRRRVFIVGSFGDGSCAEILFESESVSWNPPTRGEAGPRVAASVKASAPNRRNGGSDPIGDEFVIAATLDQRGRGPTDAVMMNLQIAGSLAAHSKEHGHAMTTQQAAESGHLVSMPLKSKANSSHYESHETYIVDDLEHHRFHCLTRGHWFGVNDYEDRILTCPKCGETHIDKITDVLDGPTAIAYRTAGNCGPFEQGDKTAALNTATDPNQNIIAFSSKDHGADAGEIAPTLRSQNFKDSHMNGGGQAAIAFQSNDGREMTALEDCSPSVKVGSGIGIPSPPAVSGLFGVRRLTPRECERLQGFPDDWTLHDADGKQISDSARYRLLGNAVAVPVAEWIGKRLFMQQG